MNIIDRLRAMGGYLDYDHEVTLGSIADTIEAQQTEITRLKEQNTLALSLLTLTDMSDTYLMGHCITLAKLALSEDK